MEFPPLLTLTTGSGDCEDYAIAKFVALRRAGIAPEDLRIVIMRDTIGGEDHAVAAVRLDGHWLTLDNRRMAMVEDAYVRNSPAAVCHRSIRRHAICRSHLCSRLCAVSCPRRLNWLPSPAVFLF